MQTWSNPYERDKRGLEFVLEGPLMIDPPNNHLLWFYTEDSEGRVFPLSTVPSRWGPNHSRPPRSTISEVLLAEHFPLRRGKTKGRKGFNFCQAFRVHLVAIHHQNHVGGAAVYSDSRLLWFFKHMLMTRLSASSNFLLVAVPLRATVSCKLQMKTHSSAFILFSSGPGDALVVAQGYCGSRKVAPCVSLALVDQLINTLKAPKTVLKIHLKTP